jgi:hypothetical protein
MSIDIVPNTDIRKLEGLLNCLPDPDHAEVMLFGFFDYSSLVNQIKAERGLDLKFTGGYEFTINKPTRKKILDVYTEFIKKQDHIPKDGKFKNIQIKEVVWNIDGDFSQQIKWTGTDVEIKYKGDKTRVVENLIKYMELEQIPFNIKVSHGY